MKLLCIDCCISVHEISRTRKLAQTFLSAWKTRHPDADVENIDLVHCPADPLTEPVLCRRESAVAAGNWDDPLLAPAHQFAEADRIVIAAPVWEMSVPAALQAYLERISVTGITFRYTPQGSEGLCKAQKMLYLTTAGGPIEGISYGSDYLASLCKLYGIGSYHFIGAPMLDVQEIDPKPYLDRALREAEKLAETF